MEIPVVLGPGGGRDVTSITSSADVVLDLSVHAGKYVELIWDQAVFCSFIPAAGTFALSTSGAVAQADNPTSGTIIGKRVAANTSFQRYVHPQYPRLIVRAQSTSATYTEIKQASIKTLGA